MMPHYPSVYETALAFMTGVGTGAGAALVLLVAVGAVANIFRRRKP